MGGKEVHVGKDWGQGRAVEGLGCGQSSCVSAAKDKQGWGRTGSFFATFQEAVQSLRL